MLLEVAASPVVPDAKKKSGEESSSEEEDDGGDEDTGKILDGEFKRTWQEKQLDKKLTEVQRGTNERKRQSSLVGRAVSWVLLIQRLSFRW